MCVGCKKAEALLIYVSSLYTQLNSHVQTMVAALTPVLYLMVLSNASALLDLFYTDSLEQFVLVSLRTLLPS